MTDNSLKIAVIGMAGRFPGASDLDAFWNNLQAGISAGKLLSRAEDGLVHYGFSLEDPDLFDAAFFDIPTREARMLDPQHRLFLECAYAALEHAGMAPRRSRVLTGVFASCNFNGYALRFADRFLHARPVELVELLTANDKDYLASRVAYKLDLKGPAMTVQCACSSSLANVATACQALLSGQCDAALAGGVSLKVDQNTCYEYEPEGPLSIDGHVRAYSDDASGVNEGEGVGVVVLKRLEDAVRDGDIIYASICGYAVSNDGADKTGFYAPSISGQVAVMAEALAMSGVDPLEIGYVEGHGTGTPLGDPMEVAALTQAWALPDGMPKQYCRLGSVKTGIGHLNAAAGVASLIKTVLALHHKTIPASLDFHAPNPRLSLESTPFKVADRTEAWDVRPGKTRKAAVNSLGLGGTNVHLVLEEGPSLKAPGVLTDASASALIVLSAKTGNGLKQRIADLTSLLRRQPEMALTDIAHTLLVGRDMQACRLSFVCEDSTSLSRLLASPGLLRKITQLGDPDKAVPVAFLFPGIGSQHPGMALELRDKLPVFRKNFDRLCEAFRTQANIAIFSSPPGTGAVPGARYGNLTDARVGTAALFAVEYSLAKALQDLGVEPAYVMGSSAGEYVAATVAGIFSEDDAVRLIAERSRLIGESPEGGMLFVPLGCDAVQSQLPEGVSVGVAVGPNGCVVSGTVQGIDELQLALSAENISVSRIEANKAGHSALLESAMPRLRKALEGVVLHKPSIPILSNVSGTWLTDAEAADPEYWVRQMREPVRLSDEIFELCNTGNTVLLEVGPARRLSAMLRRHPAFKGRAPIVPVMPAEQGKIKETDALLEALGRLWQEGGRADWGKVDVLNGSGQTAALPTYPFERQRFWLEQSGSDRTSRVSGSKSIEISGLRWQQLLLSQQENINESIGFLGEKGNLAADVLKRRGWNVAFFRTVEDVKNAAALPDILVDCRFLHGGQDSLDGAAQASQGVLELCSWIAESAAGKALSVYWPASGAASFGVDRPRFDRSVLLAFARVLPFEAKNTFGCVLDVEEELSTEALAGIFEVVFTNRVGTTSLTSLVAARAGTLWQEVPVAELLAQGGAEPLLLRDGSAYLVLGGSGGIGRTFMEELAAQATAQQCHITLIPVQRQQRSVDFWKHLVNDWTRVAPLPLDLNDPVAFLNAVDSLQSQYGNIAGIVHASGVTGGGLMQTQSAAVQDTENWKVKVAPLRGIEKILNKGGVDFVILNSSIGALCGALGQLDNSVANIVLDTWASQKQTQADTLIRSIRWDLWQQVGMVNKMTTLHERLSGETLKGGITPDEAMQALWACLTSNTELPVVSGSGLLAMLEQARAKRGLATDALESANLKAETESSERPPLSVAWRGARHALDRVLSGLFEARLGLKGIGIDDDYVELGGDSLMAMPLAKEIRELFDLSGFTVAQIFRRRTVANIADALIEPAEEEVRLCALAELLESVQRMTPEEVAKSLEASL